MNEFVPLASPKRNPKNVINETRSQEWVGRTAKVFTGRFRKKADTAQSLGSSETGPSDVVRANGGASTEFH